MAKTSAEMISQWRLLNPVRSEVDDLCNKDERSGPKSAERVEGAPRGHRPEEEHHGEGVEVTVERHDGSREDQRVREWGTT